MTWPEFLARGCMVNAKVRGFLVKRRGLTGAVAVEGDRKGEGDDRVIASTQESEMKTSSSGCSAAGRVSKVRCRGRDERER